MNVRVKLFASVRDAVGQDDVSVSVKDGTTLNALLDLLIQQHPGMEQWRRYVRFAVNWEYVQDDQILHDNDEVAVIPPVSGG